jgi:hypothetical protein
MKELNFYRLHDQKNRHPFLTIPDETPATHLLSFLMEDSNPTLVIPDGWALSPLVIPDGAKRSSGIWYLAVCDQLSA